MACRGVLFALTEEQAERFLATSSDEEVTDTVQEVEEEWNEEFLVQTDKAWDAIHRCLSDGTLEFASGTYPLNRCILGGKQMYQGDDYIISFVSANEVKDVAAALLGVTEEWFRERFSHLKGTDFPKEYLEGDGYEEMFGYAWEYLQDVSDFYQQAAEANRAVIFTVDQ